jgi:ABC-type protease/lipase transport system fused ATPase/permease subunit
MRRRGVTIVVIAHRPSMLEHVDKILVLREGKVDLYGPRDEVMAKLTGTPPPATEAAQEQVGRTRAIDDSSKAAEAAS